MKNSKSTWIAVFILVVANYLSAQTINDQIDSYLNTRLPNTLYGLSVIDISTEKEIISINEDKLLTPASTAKLVTTFTALELLGTDYKYKTEIGYSGTITDDGVLEGDVIIIGGGDPTFGSYRDNPNGDTESVIEKIANSLKQNGIKCIKGNLSIVDNIFTHQNIPSTWLYEDIGNYYGAGAWSFNIGENIVALTFDENRKNNSATVIKNIEPHVPGLRYVNLVKTSSPSGRDEAYIYGVPYQYTRHIRGTIPSQKQDFKIKGSLPYPTKDAGHIIIDQLPSLFPNAEVDILAKKPNDYKKIRKFESAPLLEIATVANHNSINIYCEAFLRSISAENRSGGTIDQGINAILSYASENDLPTDNIKLYDGSGLSPNTKTTPAFLGQFIATHIKKNPHSELILPEVAKEGTVRYLLTGSNIAYRYKLKSGSMDNVLAYAGTYTSPSGHKYALSFMVNNYNEKYSFMKKSMEEVLIRIDHYLSGL